MDDELFLKKGGGLSLVEDEAGPDDLQGKK